ncbi:MAG: hypothetical protein EOP11_08600 [Proteobacteria bacterium]|nr:MAG: hypothetical protein EOP11_08600 [Pseudomonadota bacterium]
MSMKVFDRTLEGLAKSLDLRSQAQAKVLAVDGKMPMDRSDSRHIASNGEVDSVQGEVYNQINDVVREDGNTVDRDEEMTSLFQNQLLYNAAADLVKKKLGMLKYAISDGGH